MVFAVNCTGTKHSERSRARPPGPGSRKLPLSWLFGLYKPKAQVMSYDLNLSTVCLCRHCYNHISIQFQPNMAQTIFSLGESKFIQMTFFDIPTVRKTSELTP